MPELNTRGSSNRSPTAISCVDFAADQCTYGDAPVEERPNFMGQSWWPDYNDTWNGVYLLVSCDSWGSKGANSEFYGGRAARRPSP
jgi:hypothetical protein